MSKRSSRLVLRKTLTRMVAAATIHLFCHSCPSEQTQASQRNQSAQPETQRPGRGEPHEPQSREGSNDERSGPSVDAYASEMELMVSYIGYDSPVSQPSKRFAARTGSDEEWAVICTRISGASAGDMAEFDVGQVVLVRGAIGERLVPPNEGYERLHECRVDSIIRPVSLRTPFVLGSIGKVYTGMSTANFSAAVSASDAVPFDTGRHVERVGDWAVVTEDGWLRFAAVGAENVADVAYFHAAGAGRYPLGSGVCPGAAWTGEVSISSGWLSRDGGGRRLLFVSSSLTMGSQKRVWLCGAVSMLAAF